MPKTSQEVNLLLFLMDKKKMCFHYKCGPKKFLQECISTYNTGVNEIIGWWYGI
jgi:hypothetical protein